MSSHLVFTHKKHKFINFPQKIELLIYIKFILSPKVIVFS